MNKKVFMGSRILLGLMFSIFGLNGLLMFTVGSGFIPTPPVPPEMETIMAGFLALKYLMPLVKFLELTAGLLLLANKYVNLAITLLAPIVVNILGLHLFAERSGAPMAVFISVLLCILIKSRWSDFSTLLKK